MAAASEEAIKQFSALMELRECFLFSLFLIATETNNNNNNNNEEGRKS
jgi:hypothetical protein